MKGFSFKGLTERGFPRLGVTKANATLSSATAASSTAASKARERFAQAAGTNSRLGRGDTSFERRSETRSEIETRSGIRTESGPLSVAPISSESQPSSRQRSPSLMLREAGQETVGRGLRRAREGRGMSLAELSTMTRIPAHTLRAIERDHFDGLPGEVFVRGFLRSIAKAVGLSPDAVVAKYTQSRRLDLVATTPISSFNAERAKSESRRFGVGVVCVLLVLLLALAVSIVLRPRGREMPQELSLNGIVHMGSAVDHSS
jgi:ribosome-binding protein aMBF1 (putative translation factor)